MLCITLIWKLIETHLIIIFVSQGHPRFLKGGLRAQKGPRGAHKLAHKLFICQFLRFQGMLHIKIDTNDRKLIVTHHVIEFLCQGYPRSQDYKGP